MSYTSDKNAYNSQINTDISTQTTPNSIPPEVVGSGYTDLADLLEPYINSINNQAILSGSGVPSSLLGSDLDLYYRSQSTFFELYRKEAGAWILKVTVPFSVTLPEGNLTVQTSIDGLNVIATKGGWVIANTVYSKATQTGITVAAADLNFYRHDIIYADTLNNIQYLQGTASASPVTPTLPANTILIDEVVVPSSSSGFDPYLLYGATIENETTPIRSDTGALTYEGITIASGTTVNIGACTGYVVDNETIPGESSFIFVNYAGETGKTVTTLGSGIATYVLLSGSGTIVFQNTFPTSAQRKTHIYLSKISHPAGTITVAADEPDFVLSPLAQFRDLFQALNYVNDGVYPSANGANLTVNVSAGNIHGNGINFVNDNTNPNELAVVPSTPATFLPRTRTGAGGAATTTIDVGNYDVAGAVTAIPGGANTSTLKYIFIVPGLGYIVQYGQTTYASLVDAIAAVGKESSFVVYPSLTNNALLIGVLAATKSATALNDTAQAQFFRADKFGQIIGAQAGVSIGTLQSSYNNSLQPQITTTTALGAVQIKRGSAADTNNVFQVLNGAGAASFSVTGSGVNLNSTPTSATVVTDQVLFRDSSTGAIKQGSGYELVAQNQDLDKRYISAKFREYNVSGVSTLKTLIWGDSLAGEKARFILPIIHNSIGGINPVQVSTSSVGYTSVFSASVISGTFATNAGDGFAYWPTGPLNQLTSTSIVDWVYGGVNPSFSKITVYYVKEPGAGTFTVSIAGSVVQTINASNATVALGSYSYTQTYGQSRVTLSGVSGGNVRVIKVSNTGNDGGVLAEYVSLGGLSMTDMTSSAQAMTLFQAFIDDYDPQLFMFEMDDIVPAALTTIGTALDAAIPRADKLFIASNPQSSNQTSPQRRDDLRAFVKSKDKSYLFFDGWEPIQPYSVLTNLGWEGDGTHPSLDCQSYLASLLMQQMRLNDEAFGFSAKPVRTSRNSPSYLGKGTTFQSGSANLSLDTDGNGFDWDINFSRILRFKKNLSGAGVIAQFSSNSGVEPSILPDNFNWGTLADTRKIDFITSSGYSQLRFRNVGVLNGGQEVQFGSFNLIPYTVATLPTSNNRNAGFVYCSDAGPGGVPALLYSKGEGPTIWRRVSDDGLVSADYQFIRNQSASPITSTAWIAGGGEALKVGTNTGLSDFAHIGIYARQLAPTDMSALIGYASSASTTLLIKNYLSGPLQLETTTGNLSLYAAASTLMSNSAIPSSRAYTATIDAVGTVYASTAPVIDVRRINGTFAAITPVVSGNTLGTYAFSGYQSAASAYLSATIRAVASSSWSTSDSGSKLEFYTTANGTVTQALAMTIDHDKSLTAGYKSSASDPTASDIPAGMFRLWKNTTSGAVKLWANDGGTLKSVTLS